MRSPPSTTIATFRGPRGCGEIGKHAAFRSPCPYGLGGSSPLSRIAEPQAYPGGFSPLDAAPAPYPGTWLILRVYMTLKVDHVRTDAPLHVRTRTRTVVRALAPAP